MTDRAADLQAAFDGSFADAPPATTSAGVGVLRLRVADRSFAVALAEVSSLHADVRVTPLPTARRGLLGVAVVRGTALAVYDLRRLLGLDDSAVARWMIVVAATAYVFDGFDGYARVDALPEGDRILVIEHRPHAVLRIGALDNEGGT